MASTNIAEQTYEMFIFLDYDVPNPEWSWFFAQSSHSASGPETSKLVGHQRWQC